jgi:hypothetical protein
MQSATAYWPTIRGFIGPSTARSSPRSFSGTLNVFSGFRGSRTSTLNFASVLFMPLCAACMLRVPQVQGAR